jgi:hypothetical protein
MYLGIGKFASELAVTYDGHFYAVSCGDIHVADMSEKRAYAGVTPQKSHNGILQWDKDQVTAALKPKTYHYA